MEDDQAVEFNFHEKPIDTQCEKLNEKSKLRLDMELFMKKYPGQPVPIDHDKVLWPPANAIPSPPANVMPTVIESKPLKSKHSKKTSQKTIQ